MNTITIETTIQAPIEKVSHEMTRAKAYLQQYDQFEGEKLYLDSAENILKRAGRTSHPEELKLMIQLHFAKQNSMRVCFHPFYS
jgi:hypothetical protein